jgi:DNA-binding response OmpR family regulator
MKKRLLVVDDDVAIRESLKKILEGAGYDVLLAIDGEEAELKLRDEKFDLVILDVNLPKRDGWDVLEFLSLTSPLLPVIMITGLMDQMATTIIPGVSALLGKPVEVPMMLKKIENLLNHPLEQLRPSQTMPDIDPWLNVNNGRSFEPRNERPFRFSIVRPQGFDPHE